MSAEQAIAALHFEPSLPNWLLIGLGVLCLIALAPALWRRARGAVWRALAFAVLLAWLAGPRLVQESREIPPDIALMVVDQTASMQVGRRTLLAEAARRAIEAEARALPDLELRTVTLAEGGAAGTPLFGAIGRALADIPRARLAGVIALTDGQVHDIPTNDAGAALLGGAPLHVLIPARGEETDRRLRIVEAPGYGIVGHSVTLRLAIEDMGVAHPGGAALLTIRRDGEPARVQSVPIGHEQAIEIPITRAGPSVLDLQAEALPGEVSQANNHAVVEINGVRDRLRVLLVSGEPHAGERTWRRLLKADPAVDLVHFTILRPPEKDDLTPLNELALIAFPVRELFLIKIREFDLIILDRFQNRGILPTPYLRNIADYVREGGALLMSVGPEFTGPTSLAATPLGAVLPGRPASVEGGGVIEGPFRPRVTDLGLRHPVTQDLPGSMPQADPRWGTWYRRIEASSVHGDTLLSSPDGEPLLVLDHVGEGRAALLLSDQIWLWSRGHDGGGPQAELLRRIAHWLMKEPELEENALSARVKNGVLSVQQNSLSDRPQADLTVTDPEGHVRHMLLKPEGPGRASATMPATLPGVWQASDGLQTSYAAAGTDNPIEFSDLRATATLLEPLVRRSGGGVHWLDNGTESGDVPALSRIETGRNASGSGWIGLQRRHDYIVTGIAALPLLPPWLALPLILGLAMLAWRRESV